MLKELFHFTLFGQNITIFGYGFMLVVAFFACLFVTRILARRVGIDPDHAINAVMIALIFGIAGARISDVLENLRDYFPAGRPFLSSLADAIDIHQGGLTFYGGFILATPACILYAWIKKIPILRGMDIVAPVLMIGLGIGRIGCFMNGCCYGEQTNVPWAVSFPYGSDAYIQQVNQNQLTPPPELVSKVYADQLVLISADEARDDPVLRPIAVASKALPVHPTEIYSTITAFLLAGLLIAFLTLRKTEGLVFAMMLILEGVSRYVLEMIRVEPPVLTMQYHGEAYGFSLSMVLGAGCVVAGAIMWLLVTKKIRLSVFARSS